MPLSIPAKHVPYEYFMQSVRTCCSLCSSNIARVRLSVPLSPPAGTTNCAVTVRSKVSLLLLKAWLTRAPAKGGRTRVHGYTQAHHGGG